MPSTTQEELNWVRQMAEREGFEPPVPCGTPDFESGTFDHSATSPIYHNELIYILKAT